MRYLDGMIQHAHAADLFRKRMGRAHRLWGDGTLAEAARLCGARMREPNPGDLGYLQAMAVALDAILRWKSRNSTQEGFSHRQKSLS